MFRCSVQVKISTRLSISSTSLASQVQAEENIKPFLKKKKKRKLHMHRVGKIDDLRVLWSAYMQRL